MMEITQEQQNRIAENIALYEIAEKMVSEAEAGKRFFDLAVQDKVRELEDYYQSELWLKDHDAFQAGLLPTEWNQEILTEDCLYDFLQRVDALEEQNRDVRIRSYRWGFLASAALAIICALKSADEVGLFQRYAMLGFCAVLFVGIFVLRAYRVLHGVSCHKINSFRYELITDVVMLGLFGVMAGTILVGQLDVGNVRQMSNLGLDLIGAAFFGGMVLVRLVSLVRMKSR